MKKLALKSYFNIDKELIIILMLVAIACFIFFFIINQWAFLNIFYLPVLLGAYFFGKRYAIISAISSVLIIFFLAYFFPKSFAVETLSESQLLRWLDLITWGLFLIVTGYCMGILYEKNEESKKELQLTYNGIIDMLSLIIESADNYTQSHSRRVSVISEMIAKSLNLNKFETENIRVAALLHDLGKIGVRDTILQKVTVLTSQEKINVKQHAWIGVNMLKPLGETVGDILPIILHHHDKYDGSGYYKAASGDIPLGARIIAVADVYDALTTDRPYRKAFSAMKARQEIIDNSGSHFDPKVVTAFCYIFPYLGTENRPSSSRLLELRN